MKNPPAGVTSANRKAAGDLVVRLIAIRQLAGEIDQRGGILRVLEEAQLPEPDRKELVSTPQGVGIKPTGHTFAPTRRVGLSTFPLATDPVSTAISESLSHFGLAADFCSSSVSSFLKSSRSRSGSRAPSLR